MLIDDEPALRDWLVATLEPLCDAEPIALARYVLALIAKDKPLDKLRENCIDRLEVFLDRSTKDFVDQLFEVIRTRRYIPEGKKENVQPKPNENTSETPNDIPTRQEDIEPTTSSSTAINQPIKRKHSPAHNNGNSKHHSENSPSAKRTQRSYSHSSTESPSPPPASSSLNTTTNNKILCKDFFDKGFCSLGDTCPYDHGANVLTYDQANYYPSYQQYNPETPDLMASMYTRQTIPAGQRTLVTVVTNAQPSSNESRFRQNDSTGPILRTKRHVTTAPYPNDRRPHDRNRKRPWQKPDGSGSGATTLELRKIPIESNTISKLNEHFSKFGTVTNVQIAFDGSPDSALVAYSTFQEAETAYKNPEPLFNNRFIKIFWHNPNKTNEKNSQGQNATTNPSSDGPPSRKQQPMTAPNPMKHHWTKPQKVAQNKTETSPKKKPPPVPAGPSTIKKEAAKKAAIEIRRKKQDLLDEQIQQQKLLLKKLETAETNEEKESIKSLMKQVDATIVTLKDSLRTIPIKPPPPPTATPPKVSQQDLLKQRAASLKKQLETLRAKTSADMRRAMSNTLETKLSNQNPSNDTDEDDEERLLTDNDQAKKQQYDIETHDEIQLLDS